MKPTAKEAQILANLYDTEAYRVFRKVLIEQRQMTLAQAAPFSQNMDDVLVTRGRIMELKSIDKELQTLNKQSQDKK